MNTRLPRLMALSLPMSLALPAHAAIEVAAPSAVYRQDFDSLAASGNAAWADDGSLPGWSLLTQSGAAVTGYTADSGSSATGSFRSFGAAGSAERALGGVGTGSAYFGSPASGEVAGYIAAAFTNTSASAYASFTLGFQGEQWRGGGNTAAQAMEFAYGFGSSFSQVAQWSAPGGRFDWASPVTGSAAAAVDGNAAGLVVGLGGTVATAWNPGETLWLRWTERNDLGNDHGLAIDNFSLAVSAVPEPGTHALMLVGLLAAGAAARRRRADLSSPTTASASS